MNKEITGEKLREIAKQYDKTLIDDDAPAPYVEGVTAKTQKIVECYLTNIFNLHPPGIVILGGKSYFIPSYLIDMDAQALKE